MPCNNACTWQPHSSALHRPLAITNGQKLELVTVVHAYTQTLDWNSYWHYGNMLQRHHFHQVLLFLYEQQVNGYIVNLSACAPEDFPIVSDSVLYKLCWTLQHAYCDRFILSNHTLNMTVLLFQRAQDKVTARLCRQDLLTSYNFSPIMKYCGDITLSSGL